MTLRAKLLALFSVLGVAPILALGFFGYTRSMAALEGLLRSQTSAIAQRAAEEIRQLYAQRQSDLLLLTENAEIQKLFRAYASGDPAVRDRVLARADPYLQRAWEIVGGPYQWMQFRNTEGTVVYALGSSTRPGGESLEISQMIRDVETNGEMGTLATSIHLDKILPYERLDTTFGVRGYSIVIDRANDIILHHPIRAFMQQNTSRLLGPEGWGVDTSVFDNDKGSLSVRDGKSHWVASFASLHSPPWTVISLASPEEFAAPFARTRTLNLILVLLIGAVIGIAFYLVTRRLTGSLEDLTVAADEIAGGNFAPHLPPAGSDEVGKLSSAFRFMAKEVREMLRRVEQNRHMAAIGQFASQLSHEVRNPLTSIKLNLQSLERDVASKRIPSDCARPVEISLREINRLDQVVRGALSLARTRGAMFEICSVHASVKDAVEVLRPQLDGRAIAVETDLRAGRDTVRGDSERLKGVFLNLLLNGADAMPRGGTIWISTDTTDSAIRIRVRDEGHGVPPDLKDKIFEPFFSTRKEGTGFGLTLALQTVEEHGGALKLLDGETAGSGAVFVVELPLTAGEPSP